MLWCAGGCLRRLFSARRSGQRQGLSASPPVSAIIIGTYRTPLLLALIAAGLAGNYFSFPIFHNLDFLFGSIFAMLALQF